MNWFLYDSNIGRKLVKVRCLSICVVVPSYCFIFFNVDWKQIHLFLEGIIFSVTSPQPSALCFHNKDISLPHGCLTFIFYQKHFLWLNEYEDFLFSCDDMQILMERINNCNPLRKLWKLKYAIFVSFLLKFHYIF